MPSGRIVAISISKRKGVRKTNVPCARLVEGTGLEGDAHASPGLRQVSLMGLASIRKIVDLGLSVGPGDFAENITTEGIDLLSVGVGSRLILGQEAVVEITQIGKVCHQPCAIYYQAGTCIFPTEGIFGVVIRGADIKVGDALEVLASPSSLPVEQPVLNGFVKK
ncbi:MAG: molybdenum cofactor sulfurase [Omnitrophica bacterium RIFCSPLOWO2_12_FULL_44_17]|uniref:Molybdenum cofactor sulfurase n=1 Tax=Candidatus Danuiimicrobium aquiferis TaxID=1801832 RepID=A0A1G1KT16_9BACT|nr:MAG: molybdenum cofactor sulfurase [Omnitrophica bacterium RIFCSPHIGHO2_02_FULL_45_28]OGW96050.1 MAG: molybdenum cofactor sulfurase [Omnitrophica bacterium RIFCSPLOWO2_12_FULL_44_17]OGX05018.1 MAG: molybdenum cofactor sulfurase [Omnitrophica bacterium RIFCSPLOWO2_02_FULL_44_11]